LLLAGAVATGIWWSDRYPGVLPAYCYPILAAAVLLLAWRGRLARGFTAPIARLIVACVLFAFAGAICLEKGLDGAPNWTGVRGETAAQKLLLMGRVATSSRARSGLLRLLLHPAYDVRADRGAATVLVYIARDDDLADGSLVALGASPVPWPTAHNPGEFDYGLFLHRRGVHALVRATDTVRVLQDAGGFDRWIAGLRSHVDRTLDRYVPSVESRSVLRALVLGDRSSIDPVLQESFVATGLVHLLAVSGLHVMIVGLVLFRLVGPLLLRTGMPWPVAEALRVAFTLAVLGLYALLAGLPTSVVRAIIMTAFLLVGPVLRRGTNSLNSLGSACLVILWLHPHSLFEAGFQLSVSAVAGIITLTPSFTHMLSLTTGRLRVRIAPSIMSGISVSTAATLSTLPVLVCHFGRASFAGIPLNVLGIPLTATGLLSIVLCLLVSDTPHLALPLGAVADVSIRILIELARAGADLLPFLAIVEAPGPIAWAFTGAGILIVYFTGRAGLQRRFLLASLFVVAAARALPVIRPDALEILFFSVGQGDATLLTSGSGGALLVDAGPRHEKYDAGDRIIVPYLRRNSVRHLNAVVLTHAHADHIGGAAAVLRNVSVGELVLPDTSHIPPLLAEILRTADSMQVEIRILSPGETIRLSRTTRVFAVAPSKHVLASPDHNNHSIVLRVEHGRMSAMLMGDAEVLSELDLYERYGSNLASGLVKVGHHGSPTSSQPDFVSAVASARSDSGWAIVSVGRRNSYGLPSATVLQRWKEAGMRTLTTGTEGGILIVSDGETLRRVQWRSPRTY
jgi:competence protein ComEC